MADKMQTRQYTEFQFVAGTTGKTLTVHDADVAQWLEDIIDERDELVQMGALDGRKLTEEVDALRHDIARHVQIAATQAQEIEQLRQDLAAARALLRKAASLMQEVTVSHSDPYDPNYNECDKPEELCAWCDEAQEIIDAALAGEKK